MSRYFVFVLSINLLAMTDSVLGTDKPSYVKTRCTRGKVVREIVIKYKNPVTKVGCEVFYNKKDEGAWTKKRLWFAEYEAGFCQERVDEFIQKLTGWDWNCAPEES